jgi:hypothetical protein
MIDERRAMELLKSRIAAWNAIEGELSDGYEYEKRFVEMSREFERELFQESVGEVPLNKNKKKIGADEPGAG